MLNESQSPVLSHSNIIRQISILDEKYTPERAQKVIHQYIQENGKFSTQIQEISKFFNKKNVRHLYIPISIFGLDCEEQHLMPAIDMIKAYSKQKDDENETIKPVKKDLTQKDHSEIKDSAIGNFEHLLDSIIFENKTIQQDDIQKLFLFEGSKTLKQYVERKKETFQEEYENYSEYFTNIPKRMFNKILKFFDEVLNVEIDVASKKIKSTKNTKKLPKSRRNLIKALEKFKYAKEINIELGIKSLHPSKVENSNIAIFYDAEKTKLFVFYPEYGSKLQIKGTTIYNVNFEKSFKINVRNFKKVFPNSNQEYFTNMKNKNAILDSINRINAKRLKLTASRSNDSMYILSAF